MVAKNTRYYARKGKGMILGKLRTNTLIKADLQYIMRIYLEDSKEEIIEFN